MILPGIDCLCFICHFIPLSFTNWRSQLGLLPLVGLPLRTLSSRSRNSHHHHFDYFATVMFDLHLTVPPVVTPSLSKRWTWDHYCVERSWCMLCTQRQDRHCRVAENSPSPSCRNQELNPGHWMYGPCTSRRATSSCRVYFSRSRFEHRKGPNLTSSWPDPFLSLALGGTLICGFLWLFPRYPHLCFSLIWRSNRRSFK